MSTTENQLAHVANNKAETGRACDRKIQIVPVKVARGELLYGLTYYGICEGKGKKGLT